MFNAQVLAQTINHTMPRNADASHLKFLLHMIRKMQKGTTGVGKKYTRIKWNSKN